MAEADNQELKNCQFSAASTVETEEHSKMSGVEQVREEEEDQFADSIGVEEDGPVSAHGPFGIDLMSNAQEPPSSGDGVLSADEVKIALDNVNALFGIGDEDDIFEEAEEDPSYYIHARESRMDSVARARRNRVDSTARPAEFLKASGMGGGGFAMESSSRAKEQRINFLDFSTHGISAPALRERLESKAIDKDALKRVESDFCQHDKLSKSDFDSLQEEVDMAQGLHRKNDLKGAKKLYMKVLEKDPLDWDCLCNLAKIHFGMGEYEKAKDLFERAIVIRPEREKTMYYLAHVLFNLTEHERAQLLFEQVVQGYKGELNGEACDRGTYHNSVAMLGLVHQKAYGNYETADTLYQVVLSEEPDHILSLDHRCALLSAQGKKEEAAKLHLRVVALDPGHTKKVCAYLDSLFPVDSDIIHPFKKLDDKFQAYEHVFSEGVKKKSWLRTAYNSVRKKVMRVVSKSKS